MTELTPEFSFSGDTSGVTRVTGSGYSEHVAIERRAISLSGSQRKLLREKSNTLVLCAQHATTLLEEEDVRPFTARRVEF